MGLYMYRFRKGKIREATVIGVIALIAAVVANSLFPIVRDTPRHPITATAREMAPGE